MKQATARTARIAGLTLGAAGGFLLVEAPPIGLLVAVGAIVIMRAAGQGLAGLGAVLTGIGIVGIALLGRVKLTCDNPGPDTSCVAPTVDAYLFIAVGLLALGLACSVVAWRRVAAA